MAKAPIPGHAKTRLASVVGDDAAAQLAAAALLDTLSVAQLSGLEVVVALRGTVSDGARSAELQRALDGCVVIVQRGASFAERLVHAHLETDIGHGVVQIGMDTPHIEVADLHTAAQSIEEHDAGLGMATDGGWWILALRSGAMASAIGRVPMSTADTGRLTHEALRRAGMQVAMLRSLSDVDEWRDATRVAAAAPHTRFARAVTDSHAAASFA